MKLELMKESEINTAFKIVQDGVNRLKEQGIDQWQKGYPNVEVIENDYKNKSGYLLKDKTRTIAYVSITTEKEDLYEAVKSWSCNESYAIVHRVAMDSAYAGQGYAPKLFEEIRKTCESLEVGCVRIDTHPENKKMIKIITNSGYTETAEMMYREGVRVAFEFCL